MTRLTLIKLVTAVVGLGIFGYGVRFEEPVIRWVGLGLIAAAWLVRVVERAKKRREEEGAE